MVKILTRFRQKKVDKMPNSNEKEEVVKLCDSCSVFDDLESASNITSLENSFDDDEIEANNKPFQKSDNQDTKKTDIPFSLSIPNGKNSATNKVAHNEPDYENNHLSPTDSKRICLKLLKKYSKLAIKEKIFSQEETLMLGLSAEYSASTHSEEDDESTSLQYTEQSSVEIDTDETTMTNTLSSQDEISHTTSELTLTSMLSPLFCGALVSSTTPSQSRLCSSDESSLTVEKSSNNLYRKVRFVTSCGEEGFLVSEHAVSKQQSLSMLPSESEVSDVTEIEISIMSGEDDDTVTVFTCRSLEDSGVTMYSNLSSEQNETKQHQRRYDI